VYFRDAEEEPMPQMIKPVAWDTVKELLIARDRKCKNPKSR
jgi:hypothetical protein